MAAAGGRPSSTPATREFTAGEHIARPSGGGGGRGGGKASNSGEGMDDFVFQITQEEFLDFMFEDLELPNLVKRHITGTDTFKTVRAGISNDGNPSRINIVRTLRSAHARRIALSGGSRAKLRAALKELERIKREEPDNLGDIQELELEIAKLRARIDRVPFLDTFDLKYNLLVKQPNPTSKAVMFCLMDVSGSMTQATKDIAKRFFILLYLFLKRNYEKIEVVFIRHHTSAREVDEEEFFYSRETGGTIVSSALKMMQEIMAERYPTHEVEHLRRPGLGRRQLERRLAGVPGHPPQADHAVRPVLHLRRDHPARTPGPVVRVRARARSLRRQLRPAADRLGIGHLPGVPRAVPEEARRMSKRQPIATGSEWTFELIQQYDREISRIAERYALDTYPNQIEVITAEQMMDAYASVGMPIGYNHWSYGKHFLSTEKNYKRGQMGLAYEIVINSDPCIAYLMEENTQCMQALVIAHACYGHNSFFKGNYLFRTWTDASSIIDYLVFAKQYIMQCEERYGIDAVEDLLDSCHALMNYGVDRYKRPYPISAEEERQRQKEREELIQRQVNDLWRTIPRVGGKDKEQSMARYPSEPQENILYFIEKNAPLLEPWQREVIRIVRKIAQYFYPQRQTQVMNEGWATFWHYTLLNDLYDEGLVNDGFMMEFLQYHTSVVYQPSFDSPYYSGINPYALGFAMYRDIRRICEEPTDEGPPLVPGYRRQRLAGHAEVRHEELQGRKLHPAVPLAQGDSRPEAVQHSRRRPEGRPAGRGDPRRSRLPHHPRDPGGAVQPRQPRAEHPDLERRPSRRPLADPAPPAVRPPAAERLHRRRAQAPASLVGLRYPPGDPAGRPARADPPHAAQGRQRGRGRLPAPGPDHPAHLIG